MGLPVKSIVTENVQCREEISNVYSLDGVVCVVTALLNKVEFFVSSTLLL